jgi:hypothetical protein
MIFRTTHSFIKKNDSYNVVLCKISPEAFVLIKIIGTWVIKLISGLLRSV